jgi:hypothetical protein
MSDVSQGPGWWVASDGKWYPPEQASQPTQVAQPASAAQPVQATQPGAAPTPAGAETSQGPGWWQATDGRWYPPQPGGYGPAPGGYGQPPKKPVYKRVWFWILIVLAVGISGCSALVFGAGVAVNHAAHVQHTVVYSVTGSGQANDITYATIQEGSGQSGEAQVTNVNLPWSKTITASGLFTAFDVSATVGSGGGTLTCTITEDGQQLSTNTASGAFASADCNADGK